MNRSESESYVTADGQPASLSWNKEPIWGLRPDLYYMCDSYGLVLVRCPLWREDGSVVYNCCLPSPAQPFSGLSPVGLRPYFTVSDSRLPFSPPLTNRRVTVEVLDPASTRSSLHDRLYSLACIHGNLCWIFVDTRTRFSQPLPRNGLFALVPLFRLSGGVYRTVA
jgi:hypothetical protein